MDKNNLVSSKINEPLVWENSDCEWCGTDSGEPLFEGPDLLMNLPGRFHFIRCLTCGLIRQNPRLAWESLKEYYPKHYAAYKPIIANERNIFRRYDRRYGMMKRLRAIEKRQNSGRLLDVGCGSGVFLSEVERSNKWEAMGIEPNEEAANDARLNLTSPILPKRFSETKFENESFDVITLWNVIEHLDKPVSDLKHAYRLLRANGWLIFSMPNLESWEARLMGDNWLGWDLPRHLYIFPRRLLREILIEIGFDAIKMSCLAGEHAAFGLSLEFLFKSKAPKNGQWWSIFMKAYHSFPSRLLFSIPFWLSDQLQSSSLITIFARKGSR